MGLHSLRLLLVGTIFLFAADALPTTNQITGFETLSEELEQQAIESQARPRTATACNTARCMYPPCTGACNTAGTGSSIQLDSTVQCAKCHRSADGPTTAMAVHVCSQRRPRQNLVAYGGTRRCQLFIAVRRPVATFVEAKYRSSLHAARCMLRVACCMQHVARWHRD
jgi:hypothetical protein